MSIRVADPGVEINNEAIGVVPNSVSFDEGLGEQAVTNVSYGAGVTEQVYSDNVNDAFGMVKMSVPPTIDNIAKIRAWKLNRNQNTIVITGVTADGTLTRVFKLASLPAKYEVPLSSDADIELEFMTNRAV